MNSLLSFPEEIIIRIMGFLDISSFSSIKLVSKSLRSLSWDDYILKIFLPHMFPWLKIESIPEHSLLDFYNKVMTLIDKIEAMLVPKIPEFSEVCCKSDHYIKRYFIVNKQPYNLISHKDKMALIPQLEVSIDYFTGIYVRKPNYYIGTDIRRPGYSLEHMYRPQVIKMLVEGHYREVKHNGTLDKCDYDYGVQIGLISK